jgi:hypothetical protein
VVLRCMTPIARGMEYLLLLVPYPKAEEPDAFGSWNGPVFRATTFL